MAEGQQEQQLTSLEREIVSRLADEYRILQDKIDKIGAFRFTIKGWSITVIIASIFAGTATNAVPHWLWTTSLIGFLLVFFFFEREQTNLRHRFGQRLLDIEAVLSRLLKNVAKEFGSKSVMSIFVDLHFVPGIGHHLRDRNKRKRGPRTFWRSCSEADVHFYIAQAVVVLLFVFWRSGVPAENRRVERHGDAGIFLNVPSAGAPAEIRNHAQPAQTCPSDNETRPPGLDCNEKATNKKEKHKSN